MNPLALLKFLPGILKTVGKVTGLTSVADAGTALSAAELSPDKRAELEIALGAQTVELARVSADELKAILAEQTALIASDDAYVRRARPTGLYAAYAITTALAVAMIVGVKLDTGAVATLIVPLFGNAAYYTYSRTREKVAGQA